MDSAELPDFVSPLETGDFSDATPDPAMTLAAEDFNAEMQTEEVEALSLDEGPEMAEEPFVDSEPEEEPFPSANEIVEEPPQIESEVDNSLTTPIDVAAVMAGHQPEVVEETMADNHEGTSDDSPDDADTQDFGDKPPGQEESREVDGVGLSDEDVDRIARRMLELAAERIEHIAWDVIPDMAEVVVRERVRELEAEADSEPS